MSDDPTNEIPKFVRRVMPNATETEVREATATFDEYMSIVWEIFQRIKREQTEGDSPNSELCGRFNDVHHNV